MIKPVVILTIIYSLCSCGAEQETNTYDAKEYTPKYLETDSAVYNSGEQITDQYELDYNTAIGLIMLESEMGNQQLKTPFKIKQSAKDSLIKKGYFIGTLYNVHGGTTYTTISWY